MLLAAATVMLVSTEWLGAHLKDEGLVILHVGSAQDYEKGHIPGARLIGLGDISITGERGLRLELPPAAALEAAFGKVGISDTSRIVIYPGTDSVQAATRVWFTLDYVGAGARASLLDGGLALWRAEGRPLSTETPRCRAEEIHGAAASGTGGGCGVGAGASGRSRGAAAGCEDGGVLHVPATFRARAT